MSVKGKNYWIKGQGKTIVLLHSSMSSKDQWKALGMKLEPDFRLISIDLYGYGDSPFPYLPEEFSTRDEAALVQDILDRQLGQNECFFLVGHSYGGAIALKFATEHQSRINAMVLFEPVTFHLLPQKTETHSRVFGVVSAIKAHLAKQNRIAATRVFIDYWSGKGTFNKLTPSTRRMFVNDIEKVVLDFKALFAETLTLEDYSRLTLPVCMIRGASSPASSLDIFSILLKTLPNTVVQKVSGGHMSPITHFKSVNRIISDFLIRYKTLF